jgi:hypothetical protein
MIQIRNGRMYANGILVQNNGEPIRNLTATPDGVFQNGVKIEGSELPRGGFVMDHRGITPAGVVHQGAPVRPNRGPDEQRDEQYEQRNHQYEQRGPQTRPNREEYKRQQMEEKAQRQREKANQQKVNAQRRRQGDPRDRVNDRNEDRRDEDLFLYSNFRGSHCRADGQDPDQGFRGYEDRDADRTGNDREGVQGDDQVDEDDRDREEEMISFRQFGKSRKAICKPITRQRQRRKTVKRSKRKTTGRLKRKLSCSKRNTRRRRKTKICK